MIDIDFSDKSKIITYGFIADEVKLFFKHDSWNKDEAMFLIGGVFPIKYEAIGYTKLNGGSLHNDLGEKDEICDYIESLLDIYNSNPDNPERASPHYFVEWAFQKEIPIPWLDFAIEHGFYKPKQLQEVDKPSSQLFDITSTMYPPELDLAIKAWQAVSNSEGKGKPKARIKAWLDDNTKISNEAKKRIAIIANWEKTGGATPTD